MSPPDVDRSSREPSQNRRRKVTSSGEAIYTSSFLIASLSNFFFFSSVNAFSLLPLYIKALGGTVSQIGGIMGTYSLTAILAQPLAGALADRFGRKRFLLLGSALGVLAAIGFAFSSRLDFRFFLLRLIQGVGYSAFYISNLTIVADMVPESRRGEAVGLFGISGLITIALSPALGERLVQVSGFPAFFLAAAAVAAAALLVSLAYDGPRGSDKASVEPSLSSLIPSARIMPPIVLSFVFGVASGTVFVFLPTHAMQVGLSRIGAFYIAYSTAAIGIRLTCGRLSDRWGRLHVILPALLLMASGSLGLVWLATPVGLLVVGALTGMAHGLLFPALSAYVIDLSGSEERGQALGAFSTAILLGSGLASFVFGVVAEHLGYPPIFLAASGIAIAAFVGFQRLGQR
ncbi:MAG: MFS transporter [Candidatus Methylomirabilis oxyfera]|nr:MFS transporter [Candidatus Methylomirabilis oxyfera]